MAWKAWVNCICFNKLDKYVFMTLTILKIEINRRDKAASYLSKRPGHAPALRPIRFRVVRVVRVVRTSVV
jgi:hypothetical protein